MKTYGNKCHNLRKITGTVYKANVCLCSRYLCIATRDMFRIPPSTKPFVINAKNVLLTIDVTISNNGPDHAKFIKLNVTSPGLALTSVSRHY